MDLFHVTIGLYNVRFRLTIQLRGPDRIKERSSLYAFLILSSLALPDSNSSFVQNTTFPLLETSTDFTLSISFPKIRSGWQRYLTKMSYSQRNLYYLRASRNVVMQAVLYLDPKNLRWMNAPLYILDDEDEEMDFEEDYTEDGRRRTRRIGDEVIKKALDHLGKLLMTKLYKEKKEDGSLSSSTSGTRKVDQHIDVDYMMAYFFRQVDKKHAILLKSKELQFPQKREPMAPPMISASEMRKNRPDHPTGLPPSRLAERHANETDRHDIVAEGQNIGNRTDDIRVKEEDDAFDTNFTFTSPSPEEEQQQEYNANDSTIDLDSIEDDKKPRISVSYTGFRIFELTLILVIEPTKRTRRLRPELFREEVQTEKHQLSATPLPEQQRQTPHLSSTSSRNVRRSLSMTGSSDEDDDAENEHQLAQQRADSRRLASVGRQGSRALFRGTPSDYEPTPTPTPAPEERRTQAERLDGDDDNDDDSGSEERPKESAGFALATQLLNADGTEVGGRGYEDDEDE